MLALTPLLTLAETGGDMKFVAYGLFLLLVIVFLILNLGVFHREAHEVHMKEAVTWSVVSILWPRRDDMHLSPPSTPN